MGVVHCSHHRQAAVVRGQDDVLAGELPLHQGCLRHAPPEDGRVDGERRKGHRSHHGRQSLYFRRIQKLEVSGRFKDKVDKLGEFCAELNAFDASLKAIDSWKDAATAELDDIKNQSGSMLPEDRVARTMDLQEDIAAKMEILVKNASTEKELLPQGDKVPQDAQDFKDELNRITKYVAELQAKTKAECDKYSEDVKFWAEYRTGIKEFTPWLSNSEEACTVDLTSPP